MVTQGVHGRRLPVAETAVYGVWRARSFPQSVTTGREKHPQRAFPGVGLERRGARARRKPDVPGYGFGRGLRSCRQPCDARAEVVRAERLAQIVGTELAPLTELGGRRL